jgi:hypothetical protein
MSALAPWSTLASAEDPACKGDAGGWRVTIQTLAPWLKLAGDVKAIDEAPMLARVRWSAQRVCIEAVELRSEDVNVSAAGALTPVARDAVDGVRGIGPQAMWDAPVENWILARFAGGTSAGRVGVLAGAEVRQAMECKLAP